MVSHSLPKKVTAWLVSAVLMLALVPAGLDVRQARATEAPADALVPGEVVVTYEDAHQARAVVAQVAASADAQPGELAAAAEADVPEQVTDAQLLTQTAAGDAASVLLTVDESETDAVIDELNRQPGVKAQPNYVYELVDGAGEDADGADALAAQAAATDPYASLQYYLGPWEPYQEGGSSGIGALGARDVAAEASSSCTVAVLDSGARTTHEDLQANLDTAHMAQINDDHTELVTGSMSDPNGHGTHVTGEIGATAGNGVGIEGAADNEARVLPIRVMYNSTSGTRSHGVTTTSLLVMAYNYLDQLVEGGELANLHVINLSLASEAENASDEALSEQITHMRRQHQVLTVCAAGNYGNSNTVYPSDYEDCLSVMNLSESGDYYPSTSYNADKDLAAPGMYIYSTAFGSDSSYAYKTGTSMAAPLVCGVCALLWAYDPELTCDQVVAVLEGTAHDLSSVPGYLAGERCAGAVDADAAMACVQAARQVEERIAALPEPAAVTTDDEAAIAAARGAYDALTQLEQSLVDNSRRLSEAEAALKGARVERLAGRYSADTAAAVATRAYKGDTSIYVVISRDDAYYDALSGAGLAGALGAPILLTGSTELTGSCRSAIQSLGATRAVILGGENAVSAQVAAELVDMGLTVERVAGPDVYGTSVACEQKLLGTGDASSQYAIACNPTNFADAVSISGWAYAEKVPIMLQTWGDTAAERGFEEDSLELLQGRQVVVCGGTGAVSEESVAGLDVAARLGGDTLYDTNLAIVDWELAHGMTVEDVSVASSIYSFNGVDALAASALAGRARGVILLAQSNPDYEPYVYTESALSFVGEHAAETKAVHVLGGEIAQTADFYTAIEQAFLNR